MISRVYKAKFLGSHGETVDLMIDLGFRATIQKTFKLEYLEDFTDRADEFINNQLDIADEMYIQSFQSGEYKNVYSVDITYRIGDTWYNLAKTLDKNGLASRVEEDDASLEG